MRTTQVWGPVLTSCNFNRAALPFVDTRGRIVAYVGGCDVAGLGERVVRGHGALYQIALGVPVRELPPLLAKSPEEYLPRRGG